VLINTLYLPNYFWHSRIGGFYIGVMMDVSYGEYTSTETIYQYGRPYTREYTQQYLGVGVAANIGYKFVSGAIYDYFNLSVT
jgi:cell shape-determining protein MreD